MCRGSTYQVLGQGAERNDQTAHNIVALLLKVESTRKNQEDTGDAVSVVEVDPLLQLLTKASRRNTGESDTTRLASRVKLLGGQRVDTLGKDHHVVHTDLLKLVADVLLEEVVGTPRVEVHVPAHGDELGTRQVVEGDIVVEEFGNADDVRV